MRLRNLRSRLTLGVLSVLTVVFVIGGIVVAGVSDRSERSGVDDRLRRTAELSDTAALAAIEEDSSDQQGRDPRLNNVLRATGSSLEATLGSTPVFEAGVPFPTLSDAPLGFSTRKIDGRNVRIYVTTLRVDSLGGLSRLQATTSLRQVERRQRELRERLLLTGILMLVAAGIGTWFAADVVLRPLRRLRRATRDIAGEEDLSRRVPEQDGTEELRALARGFNDMLERLGRSAAERNRALEATRRFAADAGHELRTPMTAIQATLSTIARHPDMPGETRQSIAQDALAEQRRLVALLDGLQALARGDANPVEHAPVDLAGLIADGVQSARGTHLGTTIEHEPPTEPVVVVGWEPGIRLILDNLVRNAVRHGRPGGTVRVTLDGGAAPRLLVEDDGPGIAPEDRERIFEPFTRVGDEVDQRPGSGLGLALVAQQVGHHDATIAVDASPALGGARFVVTF